MRGVGMFVGKSMIWQKAMAPGLWCGRYMALRKERWWSVGRRLVFVSGGFGGVDRREKVRESVWLLWGLMGF